MRLRYRAPRRRRGPRIALVGKGICFDTGGINLKSHKGMYLMHGDMQGSAVAAGTLLACSRTGAHLDVDCWLALTENEIGPRAYRPQEVVRASNGVTIQVVHSDAEGRMVLADTLALASRERPRLLLDFATLTGACVNALTERYSGAFTNRADLHERLQAAGRASGERVWCFPDGRGFRRRLESTVADVMQCTVDTRATTSSPPASSAASSRRASPGCTSTSVRRAQGRPGARADRVHGLRGALRDDAARRRCLPGAARRTEVTTLTLRRPDDWHLHLRDGAHMAAVAAVHRGALRARARDAEPEAADDDDRRRSASTARASSQRCRPARDFEPLMTLYLTDRTAPDEIRRAKASGFVVGAKLYPAGATTHSDAGVTSIENTWPALEAMAERGLVLQVHGEVTDAAVDVFDREQRVHRSRAVAASWSACRGPQGRLRAHHHARRGRSSCAGRAPASPRPSRRSTCCMNRNAIFDGGVRPHHYCLPVLKRERDREALLAAATGDDPRFFLGTDSAPHARHTKEASCGCAGIFSAHAGIELYAEAFEQAGRLDRLEAFASERGADFYGLPRNAEPIMLRREAWAVPESYPYGGDELVPLRGGASVGWRLVSA